VADIFEHPPRGGGDVDLARSNFHRRHQPVGITLGVIRRAETGHRITANGGARQA